MYKRLSDVSIGEVLLSPVYMNKTLLCRAGVRVSAQMLSTFANYGINELEVQGAFTPSVTTSFDLQALNAGNLISLCRQKVEEFIKSSSPLLGVLVDYDECTFQHSINVACYAMAFAMNLDYNPDVVKTLGLGGLLHDIGKLQIPRSILNKPGKLDDKEFSQMKTHAKLGYDLLKQDLTLSSGVKQIAYQHHENFDGSGYPRNLRDKQEYYLAQIIHICDVYEALCAKRPYKEPMPRRRVRTILYEGKSTQFNPKYVDLFLKFMPMYLVGEVVRVGDKLGIVIDDKTVAVGSETFPIESLT